MGKVIVIQRENCLLLFLMDADGKPQMIHAAALPEKEALLGNMYLGRVSEVVTGIQAAFLSIGSGQKVFLPLSECTDPMLTQREYDGTLKPGDELVVQIHTPALKTKQPGATTKLSLTGQYCICCRGGHGIACSGKLDQKTAKKLKEAVLKEEIENQKKYRFLLRTNAGALTQLTPLFEEMKQFIAFFQELEQIYRHRSLYSCLYHGEPEIIRILKGISVTEYEEIVTDQPSLHALFQKSFPHKEVRLYQDPMLPLANLYSISAHLQEALGKRVWLKCGGYLVIEPTEAMVVIDVNSGKAERKDFFQVNMEAAEAVARQLRLRNYSGMIMVDFINMEEEDKRQRLLSALEHWLQKDKVKTRLVDMTALGIVEITRKKTSRPLAEWLS